MYYNGSRLSNEDLYRLLNVQNESASGTVSLSIEIILAYKLSISFILVQFEVTVFQLQFNYCTHLPRQKLAS